MRSVSSLLGRIVCVVVLGNAVIACRNTSPARTPPVNIAVDSAGAVHLAIAAFWKGARPPYPYELVVAEFARDSVGYVVTLVPAPQSRISDGGGGQVRLTRQGEVREVVRFQ